RRVAGRVRARRAGGRPVGRQAQARPLRDGGPAGAAMTPGALWRRWAALFDDRDAPDEPRYDPVHLAVVLIASQVVAGALWWLLWTALVYEGGLLRGEGKLANAIACAL